MASEDDRTSAALELPVNLQLILGELKDRDQKILWLAYVEGFSHREIGEMIEVNEKSVRVLLLRARKRAAKALADQGISREEAI